MKQILNTILKSILRRNPSIYDMVMQAATDIMLEKMNKSFSLEQLQDEIYSEAAYQEMQKMIFHN